MRVWSITTQSVCTSTLTHTCLSKNVESPLSKVLETCANEKHMNENCANKGAGVFKGKIWKQS